MLGRVRDLLRASVLSIGMLGCSRTQPAASAPPAPVVAPAQAPEPEPPPPAMPPKLDPMSTWKPGATVTVHGRVATVIWQHIVGHVPGKKAAYFDVEAEDRQTVVYWKEPPTCAGLIEVTGQVIEVRGPPKRPGAKESKVDDSYGELHIDVESARCVAEE
jgi:hypothetical protein